jgi:O-antigen/teichoic acid export membrane protein
MTPHRDSVVGPALVLMSGRVLAFTASFLLPVALVRLFEPADFGAYKQLFLVYTTLYVVGSVLAESLFYFLPRRPEQAGRYVANAALALAGTGAFFLAAVWALAPALARRLGNVALAPHLPLVAAFLMAMLPTVALEIVMIARGRYRWGALSYGVSDVARVLALLLPALVARSLHALLLGALAFACARLLASALYFRWELGATLRPRGAVAGEQLAYALPFALTVVVETLQANYHHYAVSHRFDAATFAIYAVGCFQIPLLELVASPLANVMMVRMAERVREGRGQEARVVWARTARALALVFFPVLALLLAVAPDLITFLFTDRYRASVPVFTVWSLSLALAVLPTEAVLRVYAATRFLLALSVGRLLLIAATIGGAITWLGLRGAVLVTIAAALAAKAAGLVRVARLMRTRVTQVLPWRDLLGIGLAAAASALVALVLRAALPGGVLARLVVTALVCAGTYAVFLFQSGLLTEDERQALWARLGRWPLVAAWGGTRSS